MSFDYINEAFKRLDALNEDMFDTSLTGLNNLSDFMDQDDASNIVKVIDPTAETEDAVSDSYIGKVIINCNVCHSHIFESKEDVVIDEDGVVNPEMQCPYCGEMSGFTVVGEIKPFEQTSEETPVEEPSFDDVEEEQTEDTVTESTEKQLSEGFNFDTVMSDIETLKGFLRSKGHACKSKEAITYLWSVIDLFEAGNQELNLENIAQWYEDTCRNFPEDLELFEKLDANSEEDINNETPANRESEAVDNVDNSEIVTESIDELSLTANGTHIEVDEDDNGKVTLVAEPVEGDDASQISPISDDTASEITANNNLDIEDSDETTDDEEVDIELDEVDEEGLDELGESYLKNIYENVESFKTTSVSTTDSKMIVEGTITFQSGVKRNTGFVFEAYSASSDGKVKFIGKNEHFSSNDRAFALTGTISNNKLLPESLIYNYEVGSRKIVGTVNKQ